MDERCASDPECPSAPSCRLRVRICRNNGRPFAYPWQAARQRKPQGPPTPPHKGEGSIESPLPERGEGGRVQARPGGFPRGALQRQSPTATFSLRSSLIHLLWDFTWSI